MSTQPDPSVVAARSSRSHSEAKTLIEEDSSVEEIATIVQPELLQTPQIAPGTRDHRNPVALDEKETRQLMRCQSLRSWWHIRGRMHNAGGVDCKLLETWMDLGFPTSPRCPSIAFPWQARNTMSSSIPLRRRFCGTSGGGQRGFASWLQNQIGSSIKGTLLK